jgi:VWFA-related protein
MELSGVHPRCAGLLLLAATGLFAQPDTPRYSADVEVVNLFVTVHDRAGRMVRNLTRDDFALEEEGRPQTIRYFSQESDLPLTLGLLVDTSFSQERVLGSERSASRRFFERVLREGRDTAFLIKFDFDVVLLEDATSSKRKLEQGLRELRIPQPFLRRHDGPVSRAAIPAPRTSMMRSNWLPTISCASAESAKRWSC